MCSAATSEFGGLTHSSAWQIVLYERVVKGAKVGEPHVFVVKGRWAVPSQHNH